MGLSPDEKKALAALQAKANEPDSPNEDFEVEYWEESSDGTRRGGRVPYHTGKKILGKHFPDLFGEATPVADEGEEDEGDEEPPADEAKKPPARPRTSEKYFGRGGGGRK